MPKIWQVVGVAVVGVAFGCGSSTSTSKDKMATGKKTTDKMATRSGRAPDPAGNPQDLYRYVYLATPDEGYYVGLDMASALHPQTLLCDAMNWQALSRAHGAPLRLYLAVKYGYKSLKRVGVIRFQDQRPADYWAEQGYDWYAGL